MTQGLKRQLAIRAVMDEENLFFIAEDRLPLPAVVLNFETVKLRDIESLCKDGSVVLLVGDFMVVWFEDVLEKITDMYEGCWRLEDGKWELIGAS